MNLAETSRPFCDSIRNLADGPITSRDWTEMNYFVDFETVIGPVRIVAPLGGEIQVFFPNDDQPTATLGFLGFERQPSNYVIWNEMINRAVEWLLLSYPQLEVHGLTFGSRQPVSLDRLLDSQNFL